MKQVNQLASRILRMFQDESHHLKKIGFTSTNTSLYLGGYDRMINSIQPRRTLLPINGFVIDFTEQFHQFKKDETDRQQNIHNLPGSR